MKKLAPSLLSADFSRLCEQVREVEQAGAAYLHLDVMDGHFVPNISFGAPLIKALRPHSNMVFDVHLMISHPEKYVQDFFLAGADIINVHQESACDILQVLLEIRRLGCHPAVTVKPNTPVSAIEEALPLVDMVLVMTVEPGFGGQKLMPAALKKVTELVEIRRKRGLSFEIEVDGGVHAGNIQEVFAAGADIAVAGSAIFGQASPREAAASLQAVCEGYAE